MITPKEKAEELVLKFKEVYMGYGFNEVMWHTPSDVARLLALRCVDEIIIAIDWHEFETPNLQFYYWEKVKTEIQKL